jgi:3-dehydroquinate synthetase
VQKVVIIKKSKIHQFMKLKKKEKLKEHALQVQEEVLRAVKMQENISRLNEFCKKNLQKNVGRKRNTTLLHPTIGANNLSLRAA